MNTIPDPEDLAALRARIGEDPDKVAKFEAYLSLLGVLDDDLDEGQDIDHLNRLRGEIDEARRALDA